MVLGLSKLFVIFLIISLLIYYATNSWKEAGIFMGLYILVVIVWRFLTR